MTKICNLIKRACKAIFSRDTVSKVWEILFSGAKTTSSSFLANTEIMNAAFDYAKSLSSSDASSDSKRDTFDSLMRDYLVSQGKNVGTSILNVIRETALAAVKAEAETSAK